MNKLFVFTLVLISTISFSQVEQGDKNLTFGGTYTGSDGFKSGVIYGKFGYYFTQNIEAGIQPTILLGDAGGFGLGLYGTYNFLLADAKLLPYAGVKLDYFSLSGDFSFNQTDFGGYVGAKYFLSETINIDANFSVSPNLANSEDFDLGTTVRFTVGVGFILGRLK